MIHSQRILVLGTTKVRDNTLVVHTLSRGFGRRSFLVTVSRTVPVALFLPLSILDTEIVENPKSELWRLRNISCVFPLGSIRSDMYKNTMVLFMSEVLLKTLHDYENEPGLFDWCVGSVLTLDAMESDFSNFHVRFLLEFCSALGFCPSMEDIAPFAGEDYQKIQSLLESSYAHCMLIPLDGVQRSRICQSVLDYISAHTESRLEIQSLKILSEVFR